MLGELDAYAAIRGGGAMPNHWQDTEGSTVNVLWTPAQKIVEVTRPFSVETVREKMVELGEGEGFQIGAYCVTPLALAEEYVFAQLIEGQGRRVFVAADELFGWWPPDDLGHLDVAVLPLGVVEFDLLSGARHYPADHPVLAREATVEQTLAVVRQLDVDRVVLTHISEADQVGYDEALQLQQQWQTEGLPVSMAYDGLLIEV